MVLLTMAFLFFAGIQASAAQQTSNSPDSEMINIDGKKNPELIPQWKAWEAAFELLAAGKRAGGQVLDEELQLSPADKALVYAEAASNQERWSAHKRRVLTELEPLLKTMKREDLLPKNRALILDYRQQVLDGSQRLLQRLSPEGRAWLPLWVEQLKRVVTLTIPKSELDFYRRPY
jgi:hypothetical protein